MPFNHIMLDIESTGTCPASTAMIQLSAVRFDFDTMEIDLNMFDRCLTVPGNRFWEENTRDWWLQQKSEILQSIFSRMEEPKQVLIDFYKWVQKDLKGASPILWAKPISFELPFLTSYYKQFDLPMPCHYRLAEDLNSWCRARGVPDLDGQVEFEGDAHNALHDVLHQIKVLAVLRERTG